MRGARHLSRKVALELEFVGGKTRFVAFESEREAQLVYRAVVGAKPRLLHPLHSAGLLRRRRPPSAASWLGANKVGEGSDHILFFTSFLQHRCANHLVFFFFSQQWAGDGAVAGGRAVQL